MMASPEMSTDRTLSTGSVAVQQMEPGRPPFWRQVAGEHSANPGKDDDSAVSDGNCMKGCLTAGVLGFAIWTLIGAAAYLA